MRIALFVPSHISSKTFLQPPIEFYTIRKILKYDQVDVFDFRISKSTADEIVSTLKGGQYDLIIATTAPYDMCQMYHSDYRLTYAMHIISIVAQCIGCMVGIVGAHATLAPEQMLLETDSDFVVLGEIEQTICNIVTNLKEGKDIQNVPNLVLKDGNSVIRTSEEEISWHPDGYYVDGADWEGVDFSSYFGYYYVDGRMKPQRNWGVILGSRGCPFNCHFCYNFFGRNMRFRSPKSIVEELFELESLGCEIVFFLDLIFTFNKSWVMEICNLIIEKETHIKWICQTRCDCVTLDLLKLMHKAGCYAIQYGVESFDDSVLKGLNKQISCDIIMRALCDTKNVGIIPSAFLMVGTPYDTEESLNRTIEMLEEEKIPFIPIIYTPRFGSYLGNELTKEIQGMDWRAMLDLRGHLSKSSSMMNMIKKHSILKGEAFQTVNVNFKQRDLAMSTNREQIESAKILEKGNRLEDYIIQPENKGDDFVPFISFPITNSCPFKCIYCGEGGENTISNVKLTDLNSIIDLCTKAKRMGVKKVRLTGGEPFTHPQIGDILRYLSEEGFYTLVNTNGLLIEDKVEALMRTSKNIHVAVSLDTLKADRFKYISQTTEENLDKVLRGVDILSKLGYLMRINMVVGNFNKAEIEDMIDFCREKNCDLKLQEIASVPYPHLKWEDIHCDFQPIEEKLQSIADKVLVHDYASKIGIPVKIFNINGVYVTLKAMYYGSRYETKEFCKECPHFPCHEGLYDVYVLGDGAIATCRWRRYGNKDTFEADMRKTIEIFRNAEYIGHHNIAKMERVSERGMDLL